MEMRNGQPVIEREQLPESLDSNETRDGWLDCTPYASLNEATRRIVQSVLAFGVVAVLTLTIVFVLGRSGGELEATKMTLNLAYPPTGGPSARIEGQPGAAPGDAEIACRSTSNQLKLGVGTASGDGSFDIALDASAWPLNELTGDSYRVLNRMIECRAGDGPWVEPLRPPRVAIG